MVDASHQFVRPHVIDIKIGAQAWQPNASVEKMKRQKARCPHLDEICFQVLGAKYYDSQTGEAVIKLNLRKYSPYNLLHSGLFEIFGGVADKYRGIILQDIIQNLNEILEWFSTQQRLLFRGSSVLIVFESHTEGLSSHLTDSKVCPSSVLQVKLIDFVHVWEADTLDTNYIEGITSVIKYFTDLSNLFTKPSST